MIERIISIKNVGRFRKFDWHHDSFGEVAVIYGENGTGKTTLSSLLRAASLGQSEPVTSRATLGATSPSSVTLLAANNTKVTFDGRSWSQKCDALIVFNRDFVHDTVFVGRDVPTDQRERLYEIAIGEAMVLAKNETDQKTKAATERRNAVREVTTKLDGRLRAYGATVDQFRQALPLAAAPPDLAEKRARLAQRRTKNLAQLPSFASLPAAEPFHVDTLRALLDKCVETLSLEASAAVSAHIGEHLGEGGEAWLAQGTQYATDDVCPYCAQSLSTSAIAALLSVFFDKSYRSLQQTLEKGLARVDVLQRGSDDFASAAHANELVHREWRVVAEMEAPPEVSSRYASHTTTLMTTLRALLKEKLAQPLAAIGADPRVDTAAGASAAINEARGEYARWLASVQQKTGALRGSEATTTADLEADLRRLDLRLLRADRTMEQLLADLDVAISAAAVADRDLENARAALATASASITKAFVDAINDHLKDLGAEFKIRDLKPKHSTARVGADFALEIGVGQSIQASANVSGKPRFDTVLSEGDRSTLALAVFAATVFSRADLARCTVVLDDPFTSLDLHRRNKTCHLAKKMKSKSARVIVLSHDPGFLLSVVDICSASWQRKIATDGATLEQWDARKQCEHAYLRDLSLIRAFSSDGGSTVVQNHVWLLLRPTIEEYLRFRYPRWWAGNRWLGDFVDRAKAKNGPHEIGLTDREIDLLDEWKWYGNPPHHAARPCPSEAELRRYAGEILEFLEH